MQTFACVELRDPGAWLAALPEAERRRLTENRLIRPPCLMMPNGALDAPLDRIAAVIEDVHRHPD